MDGGRRHGGVADRDTELVKVRYDVACRIQTLNCRLLMAIDFEATNIVTQGPQLEGHLGAYGASESRIKERDFSAASSVDIHMHGALAADRNPTSLM